MTNREFAEAFIANERAKYCANCERRKNSKGKTVYEIGDAPCRACEIDDVLTDLDDHYIEDEPIVFAIKSGKCERVDGSLLIHLCDGVHSTTAYVGSMSDLLIFNFLKWRKDEDFTADEVLTLDEIKDQIKEAYGDFDVPIITVYVDDPFCGQIYTYGNHGDFWELTGETGGYA